MIRINLLPVRETKRQANLRKQGVFLGLAAGVGVLLSILLGVSVAARTSDKEKQILTATEELQKLQKIKDEVEKFRAEKAEIERKLGVIANLEKTRTGQVKILDEIATKIPERVWLDEMALRDGVITLSGVSIDAEIVAEFMTSLSSSELFRDVTLSETTLKEKDGLKLNAFQIEARYGPDPAAAAAAAQPGAVPAVRR
jgi:type IV pilus assembly protein PilN